MKYFIIFLLIDDFQGLSTHYDRQTNHDIALFHDRVDAVHVTYINAVHHHDQRRAQASRMVKNSFCTFVSIALMQRGKHSSDRASLRQFQLDPPLVREAGECGKELDCDFFHVHHCSVVFLCSMYTCTSTIVNLILIIKNSMAT